MKFEFDPSKNEGSLGFAVMHHQFWRQLYCRPPAVQLLGKLSRRFPESQNESNRQKRGIDFVEAQALWQDGNRVEIPAKTVDEPRSLLIGQIKGKVWSAIITYRGENIRIISVRRARDEEVELYESI